MTEPVFLIGLAMFATTVVLVAKTIAGAIGGRGVSRSELAQLREQLDQLAAALEDTETRLASQSTQLSELHERLDFAERLLTKAPDRSALGPGDKPR
jgi:chromosome segregation ATPase